MSLQTSVIYNDAELKGRLARLQTLFSHDGIAAILQEVAKRAPNYIVLKYPEATGAPMADLWTDQQRKWFFAALKEGRITVPYRRKGNLGRALEFDLKIEGTTGLLEAKIVGIPSAKYVIGEREDQSIYFRTRTKWQAFGLMIAQQRDAIREVVEVSMDNVIKELLA